MRLPAALSLVFLGSACQLTSTTVLDGTIFQTPAVTTPDGSLPAQVNVVVSMMHRDLVTQSLSPLSGATVELVVGDASLDVPQVDAGLYVLTRTADSRLVYTSGASYDLVATLRGATFRESVAAPTAESVPELSDLTSLSVSGVTVKLLTVQPGVDLVLHRRSPVTTPAVVAVVAADASTEVLYSSPSLNLEGVAGLVLDSSHYEGTAITIPSSAWGSCSQPYVLIEFSNVALGSENTDNLSLGSLILAGSTQIALAHCSTGTVTD